MRYEQMIHKFLNLIYPSLVNDRYVQMHLNLWFRRETAKVDILETALLMTVGLSPEFIRELIIENSKNPTASVKTNTKVVAERHLIIGVKDQSIIDGIWTGEVINMNIVATSNVEATFSMTPPEGYEKIKQDLSYLMSDYNSLKEKENED